MKIVSTNIAEPTTIEWRGQEVQTGIYKYPVEAPIFLGTEDVENDHVLDRLYHGGVDKACYLYSADHYSFWKNKYPSQLWQWGMFGENLTVAGLNESEIRIGDRFKIGDAEVQVSQPRQPCFKLGVRFGDQKVVDDFWQLPYPGIYVRVLQSGNVRVGDELVLIDRNTDSLAVSEVFSIFRLQRDNADLLIKAINDPLLAESCRTDIRKILDFSSE
ncbi:MAG: MOSC domain-containing protein [Prolixibacteraceae bacterium]|nr:MOSC domain-containing protein [Prolixibacteraceae bacterium]